VLAAAALAVSVRLAFAADITDADRRNAAKLANEVCSSCHGQNGRSAAPTFPHLAAQTAPYLEVQLKAFRDQSRGDPDAVAYMWGMASQLDDVTIGALSEYYAQQKAAGGRRGTQGAIDAGRKIFEQGIPERQIAACESCHGKGAEGIGAIPRLAGQHAPYLFKQMLVIQNVLRTAPVMHGVVKDLTRDQMQAIAAFLESL